jgi:hypothetical protein
MNWELYGRKLLWPNLRWYLIIFMNGVGKVRKTLRFAGVRSEVITLKSHDTCKNHEIAR